MLDSLFAVVSTSFASSSARTGSCDLALALFNGSKELLLFIIVLFASCGAPPATCDWICAGAGEQSVSGLFGLRIGFAHGALTVGFGVEWKVDGVVLTA